MPTISAYISDEAVAVLDALTAADNRSRSNLLDTLIKQEQARRERFGVKSITETPASVTDTEGEAFAVASVPVVNMEVK